jgi:hypothetical protein
MRREKVYEDKRVIRANNMEHRGVGDWWDREMEDVCCGGASCGVV